MTRYKAIFSRTELLLGEETMQRLASKRVIVFGVGGVGSWCAESLIRSGIQNLTLVDGDSVSESNLNRQLPATTRTIGRVKVDVLKERLLEINPEACITARHERFSQENAQDFDLGSFDYVIDAIDSLKDKAQLILSACSSGATLFSSMGAGAKIDPTRIKACEFWEVKGDPLARMIRKKFKHLDLFPERKFLCVCSDELLENKGPKVPVEDSSKACVNGTMAHITAIFGFTLAGLVIKDICRNDNQA